MFKYRTIRDAGLEAELSDMKEFETLDAMREYVYTLLKYWAINRRDPVFVLADVRIGEDLGDETETGWKHLRCVFIERRDGPVRVGWCGE